MLTWLECVQRLNIEMATKSDICQAGAIVVHPLTNDPKQAWKMLEPNQTVRKLKPLCRRTPIDPKKVRFVCLSDTHRRVDRMPEPVPNGDVLIHAGDFSEFGRPKDVEEFNEFLGSLPHKRKIIIAGNHDILLDGTMTRDDESWRALSVRFRLKRDKVAEYLRARGVVRVQELLTNCSYLQDSQTDAFGLRIYGSPWQPEFRCWGFNLSRGQPCLDKWNLIPAGVDVLVTHGPPIGHGDLCKGSKRAGCVELLNTIQNRVKPKYHVFGHIHEGYGISTDGVTTFINASTCTFNYRPTNPPIIFDLPLPTGCSKLESPSDIVDEWPEVTT